MISYSESSRSYAAYVFNDLAASGNWMILWTFTSKNNCEKPPLNLANLEGTTVDFYRLLAIHRTASDVEIKSAYHQALLTWHPDRNLSDAPVDIALFKEAYSTLSTPHLRAQYDEELSQAVNVTGPRPAQVVSLEDFEEEDDDGKVNWRYPCRCGGLYRITEEDLDNGQHLVGCGSCSEVVWVGYEQAEGVEWNGLRNRKIPMTSDTNLTTPTVLENHWNEKKKEFLRPRKSIKSST